MVLPQNPKMNFLKLTRVPEPATSPCETVLVNMNLVYCVSRDCWFPEAGKMVESSMIYFSGLYNHTDKPYSIQVKETRAEIMALMDPCSFSRPQPKHNPVQS
jgi:hypothetical protein